MINVLTVAGRVGRDAEVRFTGAGKAVAGFPLAVDVGYGDNNSTMWVDCSIWGERGEKLAEYLVKGSMVTVTGEANLQTYQSQGAEKTKLTCRVNDVQLPPKSSGTAAPAQRREPVQQQRSAPPVNEGFDDDDIPF